MADVQSAANAAFNSMSFFILTGLPKTSEVGVDSKLWQINQFSGFKLLPPGLHFFVFAAAASASANNDEPVPPTNGVRQGLLRFFSAGETIVEEWNKVNEELSSRHRSKRRREEAGAEEVISESYLKSLDKELAPYPAGLAEEWTSLTGFITRATLSRVIGLDARGSAMVDGVMGSKAELEELVAAGGSRTVWGKERVAEVVDEDEEEEDREEDMLSFVLVNPKRSWPDGAIGEELTRWSKDKSWYLSKVVANDLGGDAKEYLAELQLSFILFTLLHNFSSLSTYKALFALLCRSSSLAHPLNGRRNSSATILGPSSSLPLLASFLSVVHSQLTFLDESFFTTQLPSLDFYLITELSLLRDSLSDAAPFWASSSDDVVWQEAKKRWNELASLAMEKFGWELGEISRRFEYVARLGAAGVSRDEDEIDLEELEEGEDAPVIVEL